MAAVPTTGLEDGDARLVDYAGIPVHAEETDMINAITIIR